MVAMIHTHLMRAVPQLENLETGATPLLSAHPKKKNPAPPRTPLLESDESHFWRTFAVVSESRFGRGRKISYREILQKRH